MSLSCWFWGFAGVFTWFTRPARAAWSPSTWGFRKKLTIDYTKVSGGADLSNFPVLVSLSDIGLAKAQANGNDILFTSGDGTTKLDHEIEKFTRSSGELVAWVRIPTLSYTANTIIYMYYGNSSVPSQQNKTGVWTNGYNLVQHMTGAAYTDLDDSSSNNQDITGEMGDPAYNQASKIGNAVDMDGDGDWVYADESSTLEPPNNMTLSVWVKFDQLAQALGASRTA